MHVSMERGKKKEILVEMEINIEWSPDVDSWAVGKYAHYEQLPPPTFRKSLDSEWKLP